jgi:hypothetical protein
MLPILSQLDNQDLERRQGERVERQRLVVVIVTRKEPVWLATGEIEANGLLVIRKVEHNEARLPRVCIMA